MRDRDAENLAACRILIFAFALLHYGFIDFTQWAHVPAVFWRPIALFRLFPARAPSFNELWAAQWIWRASLLLSCLGLFTRVSLLFAGVFGAYLIALPNNYSNVHRIDAAFLIALLLMSLSRSGAAWSLDSLLSAKRRTLAQPVWKLEYKWPVTAIRILLAISFLAAGVAKLRHRGLDWITTDSLSILIAEQARLMDEPLLPSLAQWVVSHPLLCSVIAGVTVITETLQPLALISRSARLVLVPSVALMLLGIRLIQGPAFYPLIALQLFWVDWPWVLDKFRSNRRSERTRVAEGPVEHLA